MQTFSLAIECTLNLAVNFAEIKESPVLLALLSAKACAVLEMSLLSQKGYQGLSQFSDHSPSQVMDPPKPPTKCQRF